ncbi:MAG: peptidoglycan editing factor PgeF [Bryobacteraceae bacterium]
MPWTERPWLEHGFGTRLSVDWNQREDWISLNQVHSDRCLYANGETRGRTGQGDALLTDVPGAALAVRTADCVPLFLVDPLRRAVAVVHAGWRGTALSIAAKAVKAMAAQFGSPPADLEAVLGPAIGPCCYMVGPEVAVQFQPWFPEPLDLRGPARLDLPEANRRQLLAAGLSAARVHATPLCTCCQPDLFHSYRRDRDKAGRMVSGIQIRA